ncbi:DegT/DnrJ/EryC1/StrS family aminotransferase [Pedosphaera parvula]|uniref:DegT/DnrJ/EryC1/StrS aminotransferase n=1 Tax=Pedosphaera parvula (strain Ellin514) TaxID=320771 RepID=B9XAW7_PEDPL|nr:DegT/DnrJ/EryC1/StrS family aminotransferase [Pedosphaera parvula]EEF63152.1 DegT/DnrJ/EryC1/StrS aminotransferase [Pedosphaera parvula Ellin514]
MINVPFHKPSIGPEEINEVVDTLKNGWLTTGPKAKLLEKEFACYLAHQYAVAVNSCTAALHLALEAIGLQAGECVLVPSMTFAATAEVVRYFNARPILVDCRSEDFNLDVADAERRILSALSHGEQIRAIIPVHYAGQIGDVAGVAALAKRYDLRIIEDAAHCCPAFYRLDNSAVWQTVGTGADISCYSFYANKAITTGEGGMACTHKSEYAERMRVMSLHGISKDAWKRFTSEGSWYYEITAPGFKYNLTDIAASIGLHQLRKSDDLHRKRTYLANRYAELLGDVDELVLPVAQPNRNHSWHLYVIRLKLDRLLLDRAAVIEELKRAGIGVSVHWLPLHMHPYYRNAYGYEPADLPRSAQLYPEIISLPIFPDMNDAEVEHVCNQLRRIISGHLKISPKLSGKLLIHKPSKIIKTGNGELKL